MNDGASQRTLKAGALVLWAVNLTAVTLLAVTLLVLVPKMTTVFADFGTRLPGITVAILTLGHSPVVVLIGLGWLLAVQGVAYAYSGNGRSLVLTGITLLVVLLVLGIALAVGLPFVELVNSSSGQGTPGA
jgi:hypothetical protein